MIKTTALIPFLSIVIIFWWQNSILAQASEAHDDEYYQVEAEGQGESHDSALKAAMRAAIEKAVGIYVQSETEVQNWQLKKDQIISHTEAFITAYEILDKYRAGNQWNIKIKATVSNKKLVDQLQELQILQKQMDNPKILVYYDKSGEQYEPRYTQQAINSINEYLVTYRYEVVDLGHIEDLMREDQALQEYVQGKDLVFELARRMKADVYLTVAVVLENTRFSGGRQYSKAKATVKAFEASTAKLLATRTDYGPEQSFSRETTGYDASIDMAVKEAMPYVIEQIQGYWKIAITKGSQFKIFVNGISFPDQIKFIQALKNIANEVKQEGSGENNVEYTVWFTGTNDELVMALYNAVPVLGGKNFDRTNRGNRIDIFYK
jgi:hypothetical protein